MPAKPSPLNRQLRATIRNRRAGLSRHQQQAAELALARRAQRCFAIQNANRLASYHPIQGEISPASVMVRSKVELYFPRIQNFVHRRMLFQRAHSLRPNRWGILEPDIANRIATPAELDVILMPLVAFDRSGHRIGMGAGFYDRALAPLTHQPSTRPLLVGLAHHFQEVNSISAAPWDVPLDVIITDREYITCAPAAPLNSSEHS
ncbi:5-formyltetrahydrofolate cyclo-ligase [Arenicella chitinivorans]|uniref:5-formyltetrahydrofolate cyclo-ligase n=1 Tax=Arenicella chitinivorans TaxID=1329800 RepID=UPI0016720017|nr:5-formyltetrahydrofolate cyclo-ligase [Arenicella chitinivorans]